MGVHTRTRTHLRDAIRHDGWYTGNVSTIGPVRCVGWAWLGVAADGLAEGGDIEGVGGLVVGGGWVVEAGADLVAGTDPGGWAVAREAEQADGELVQDGGDGGVWRGDEDASGGIGVGEPGAFFADEAEQTGDGEVEVGVAVGGGVADGEVGWGGVGVGDEPGEDVVTAPFGGDFDGWDVGGGGLPDAEAEVLCGDVEDGAGGEGGGFAGVGVGAAGAALVGVEPFERQARSSSPDSRAPYQRRAKVGARKSCQRRSGLASRWASSSQWAMVIWAGGEAGGEAVGMAAGAVGSGGESPVVLLLVGALMGWKRGLRRCGSIAGATSCVSCLCVGLILCNS